MLYYTILYYSILYSTILYPRILYYALLYFTVYHTMLYDTILCYILSEVCEFFSPGCRTLLVDVDFNLSYAKPHVASWYIHRPKRSDMVYNPLKALYIP